MIVVSMQDMLEFIERQPDDRKVDFSQTSVDGNCGCIMVQYAIDKGIPNFGQCSIAVWWDKGGSNVVAKFADNDISYSTFKPDELFDTDVTTYGEIKKFLARSS